MKLPIDLNTINKKYRPFVSTSVISICLFLVIALFSPILLLLEGVPFYLWKQQLYKLLLLGIFGVCTASLLSLLYGYLKCSKTNLFFSTLLFGLATPAVMLLFLYLPSWLNSDFSPFVINSREGVINFVFVFVLFSILGGLIYIAPNKQLNQDATTVAPIS